MSQLSSISILATGIVFGVLISTIYYNSIGRKSFEGRVSQSEKPFFLGVAVTFTTLDSKQTFLKEFGEYAKYVKNYEPTTLSYEVNSIKLRLHIHTYFI